MTDTREVARKIVEINDEWIALGSPQPKENWLHLQLAKARADLKAAESSTGDLVEALRPYIQHLSWCHKTRSIVHPCDCGLEAALLAAQEKKA